MNQIFLSFMSILFAWGFVGCAGKSTSSTQGQVDVDPIHLGNETLPYDAKSVVKKAMADFSLSASGNLPYFAQPQAKKALGNSETVVFQGDGYILKVLCNPAILGDVAGYYYGPVLSFTKLSLAEGHPGQISNVQFYTRDEIRKLRKNKKR